MQREALRRRLGSFGPQIIASTHVPNLERAAELLKDSPALWAHPGTTDEQREKLVSELLEQAQVRGKEVIAVRPKDVYQLLFGYLVTEGVRRCRGDWIRTSGPLHPMRPLVQKTAIPC